MRNKLRLPKAIYSKKAIDAAIIDYMHIAKIELMENQTHYICKFSKCVVDEQRVLCEFNNYPLNS
jgi:hypothetical protein